MQRGFLFLGTSFLFNNASTDNMEKECQVLCIYVDSTALMIKVEQMKVSPFFKNYLYKLEMCRPVN